MNRNACAYKEIYEILKIFPEELVNRVPQEKIDFFFNNMDKDHEFHINKEEFDEDSVLEETAAILLILFRDYWATPEQRQKIIRVQDKAKEDIENRKREKYNTNDIFKSNKKEESIHLEESETALIEIKKENLIGKIMSIIKSFLKK